MFQLGQNHQLVRYYGKICTDLHLPHSPAWHGFFSRSFWFREFLKFTVRFPGEEGVCLNHLWYSMDGQEILNLKIGSLIFSSKKVSIISVHVSKQIHSKKKKRSSYLKCISPPPNGEQQKPSKRWMKCYSTTSRFFPTFFFSPSFSTNRLSYSTFVVGPNEQPKALAVSTDVVVVAMSSVPNVRSAVALRAAFSVLICGLAIPTWDVL